MKRSLSLIFALTALLVLCGNQANGKDNWTRVQTKNFTLVGNANERDIRKIAIKLETFRETLSQIFPKARITTAIPTTVVIFKSDDAFRPFKPRYQGKIRNNVGGYFIPGPHMNYIALAAEKELIDPYAVIFHEYEHFVLRNNLLHIPVWLDEGLAEFYSSFETKDNDQGITVGSPLAQHVYYLRSNSLLPLKTLLTVDRKSPYYNESSKAGAFYAESWALVHYLMMGNKQKRQPQLMKFIDLVNSGVSVEESFNRAFQANFETIENELRSYVNKFLFTVLNGTFKSQLNFDKEMQSSALSEGEIQYYEGDLLLNLHQIAEAKALLEKSVAFDARYSRSLVSLGIVRLIEKHPDEAAKLFQSAVESDPGNYLAHYYYAATLTREQHYEEAIKSYNQAISLKSDLANLFVALGYAYLNAGHEEDAIKTFEKGTRVNPRETDCSRALGYIHLQRGEGDAAANDAYNYLSVMGWRAEHSRYMALVWYFALRKGKHDAFATKSLQESIAKVDPTDWPFPVLQFLNHTATLPEMLALADDNDKLTEAHAYAGLALSINGETQAALEHLRWVKDNGNKDFVEYPLALAEIARLEGVDSK
jgi:tetratricopeptide (TPR) repeat protein